LYSNMWTLSENWCVSTEKQLCNLCVFRNKFSSLMKNFHGSKDDALNYIYVVVATVYLYNNQTNTTTIKIGANTTSLMKPTYMYLFAA